MLRRDEYSENLSDTSFNTGVHDTLQKSSDGLRTAITAKTGQPYSKAYSGFSVNTSLTVAEFSSGP
jgi:hypothetical protein